MTANSASLLKGAVHQHKAISGRGMSERLFTSWFGGFFYNQIWEDPRVDMEALRLDGDSRMLTISSAGCNVLNYLTRAPASITAVDLNQHHIYLTRLKLAALSRLPSYDDFYAFFGYANKPENRDNYYTYIQGTLDDATRYFWEGGSWVRRSLRGPRIDYFTKNLYDYAKLGYFLRFAHGVAKVTRKDPALLLEAKNPEEQARIFDEYWDPFFDHWLVKAIGRIPFLLFGLGIPPRQLEALREETGGQILEMYRERVRKLACGYPVDDNYFTWQAFARQYDHENRKAVPEYLKAENYDTIKPAAERVSTEINTVVGAMRERPADSLNRFVFLDSQDWMTEEQIAEQWAEIARVGQRGSRIIFRTASSLSPVEAALPSELRQRFFYDEELSKRLHEQDRSAIYGGFHVYELQR